MGRSRAVPRAVRRGVPRGLDALWDYNDPARSETRFRRYLRIARKSGDIDLQAEAITQLARAQGLQRKFRTAHRTLDGVPRLFPRLGPRARVRYLLERGRVFNSAGSRRSALPLFLNAWRVARRHREDGLAVDAAHMVAIVKSGGSQEAWNLRALRLAERSRDPSARHWRASLHNNLGWSRFEAGDYRAALRSFQRAVLYRKAQGVASESRIAEWCVAKTLRLLGRTEEALRMQRTLLASWQRARKTDGYVFEELGECLRTLGRDSEARRFFRSAHAELSKDPGLVASEPARLKRLAALGRGP